MTQATNAISSKPRRLRGVVVRTGLPKTVTVRVERLFRHPKLQRVMRQHRKFLTDDAGSTVQLGDTVFIEETRPLSRHKRWKIVEVVESVKREEGEEEAQKIEPVREAGAENLESRK